MTRPPSRKRSHARARRCVTALLLLFLAACDLSTTTLPLPTFPPPLAGAVAFTPPPEFDLWWVMVQRCSGFSRDVRYVSWYMLPGAATLPSGASGTYYRQTSQILLAEEAVDSAIMVRHEMLHSVLPVGGHPRAFFLEDCEGIVNCRPQCVAEAGGIGTPAASAPEILPADLITAVEISPPQPLESFAGGAVAVVLSVTNPHAFDVWVRLTPLTPGGTQSATFGASLDTGNPALPYASRSLSMAGTRFGLLAKQTRRFALDDKARAGTLGVRAWFNSDTLDRTVLEVRK